MDVDRLFWTNLDRLVAEGQVVVDRPRGSAHPRHRSFIYPLDYGYLAGTDAMDGSGVDVWRGSRHGAGVTAVLCTIDMDKMDIELKLLLECTMDEIERVVAVHRQGTQAAILLERPRISEQRA